MGHQSKSEQNFRQKKFNGAIPEGAPLSGQVRTWMWIVWNRGVTAGLRRKWKELIVTTRLVNKEAVDALHSMKILLEDFPEAVEDLGERSIITAMDALRLNYWYAQFIEHKGFKKEFAEFVDEQKMQKKGRA